MMPLEECSRSREGWEVPTREVGPTSGERDGDDDGSRGRRKWSIEGFGRSRGGWILGGYERAESTSLEKG